jgi:hypothetical protein
MSQRKTPNDLEDNPDGFNVVDVLTPEEWVDFGYDHHSEYIHLVPDVENRQLRCYRSVTEPGVDNKRIMTTLNNVRFSFFGAEVEDINYVYLTYMEAMSFMSFIDLMNETGDGNGMMFKWSDSDGGTMMDSEKTNIEALTLTFTKENGVKRSTEIRSEWQSAKSHRMASIEGEAY